MDIVDRVLEIVLSWYQDGRIESISPEIVMQAYSLCTNGTNLIEAKGITAQVMRMLEKDADKPVLYKAGTTV